MSDLGFEPHEIVNMLKAEQGYPKGLEPEKYDLNELRNVEKQGFIHETAEAVLEAETAELDWLDFKLSGDFKARERLFDIEREIEEKRKADEEYEWWLSVQYEKYLPLEQQLKIVQYREKQRMATIRRKQSIYRAYFGRLVAYRKKPVEFTYCDF